VFGRRTRHRSFTPFHHSICIFTFTCAPHETHSKTSTQASAFHFHAWFSRSQDWRRSCRPLCRANPHPTILPRSANSFPQVLNKVAGIYGLIALLTGAGGNAAQLTLYIYSALALIGLSWGIRAVNQVRRPLIILLIPTYLSPRRRTQSICFILLTYSSPIISLIPSGPFISLSIGGYIPPTTAAAMQTLRRSRRLSMDTSASIRPCQRQNAPQQPSECGTLRRPRR
jgi:Inositolphosphorylceramide synthase subunit Kei1